MATLRITRLLKKAWEDYLHTNTCQQSERCEKLDIFLGKFLWLYNENKFDTCPRFSDLISIGNILTRQFLTDINYVCSQCSDKDDDAAPLVNYLLEGRGWKILWLIEFIGVQGLACNKELANLLLSLFPLCSQFPISTSKNKSSQTRERTLIDIEACFRKFINTSNSAKFSLDSKRPSSGEMHRSNRHQNKKALKNRSLSQSFRITRVETTDTEYIPEIEAATLKEQLVQIQLNPFDFSYFTMSGVRSSEDEKGFEDTNEISQEEMENIQSLIQQPLNSLEFCESVISLLQKICQGDQSPQNTLSIPVSATILPFAVNMLLTVHQGRGYTENWNFKDSHHTKQQLLHLVFTAAAALAPHPDGVFFIEQARVIPSLVTVVQEIQNILQIDDSEATEQTSKGNLLLLAFNIMYGCLMLICIIVEKAIPTQDYAGIIQLFRLFSINDGYALCSKVFSDYELLVQNEEKQLLQHRITELIETMSRIINYMKSVRQLHFHNQICKKRRHRWCNLNIYGNHHHNLFGVGCTQSIFNKSPVCCISSAIILLLQIYSASHVVQTQLTILGFLTKVGFCCCLNVVNVLKYLLDCLPQQTAVMRQIALSFIETTVLEQLGGTDSSSERFSFCITCKTNDATFLSSLQTLKSLLINRSINTEEKILQVSGHMTTVWNAVEKYSNFLISHDVVLIHQVERHLLHLCSAGNQNVKCELLLQIFIPRFFNIANTISNKTVISEHVLACCLSAFCILCKHQSLADIFFEIGGLQILQNQLQFVTLRPLVLRVLHVLIIADITKFYESQKNLSLTVTDVSDVMSSQLHSKTLSDVQSVLVFQEILLQYNANYLRNFPKYASVIKDDSPEESNDEPSFNSGQQLTYMADLWSTCAVLVHQSYPFKLHCENNLIIGEAYKLMLELLQLFIKMHDTSSDSVELETVITKKSLKSLLSLLDSLLIMCLEMTPFNIHPEGKVIEKHNIIELLRSMLKNLNLWPPIDVRSLLETLIHAAIGQPFGNWQKSEYLYLEEFLPLFEEVEDVELDLSEVSTGVENIMADEGYDADVELLDNSKELEASFDDSAMINACGSETSLEHALKYSDLCSLVLELLVQFAKQSLPNKEQEYEYFMALTSVINRLVSLCRDCVQNCMILYHQGMLKIILEGFYNSISDNSKYSELKLSLLDLFVLVAQCAITADELCLYLSLFKAKNSPLNYLLIFFNTLVDKVVQQPTYIMYFPTIMPQNHRDPKLIPYIPSTTLKTSVLYPMKTSRSSSVNTVSGKTTDTKQRISVAEDTAKQFCIQHQEQNITSSFSACALEIPLQAAHFTTFQKGFSIAAWLRVCRSHYSGQTKFHGAYNLKNKTGLDDSWQHDESSIDIYDDVLKKRELIDGQIREHLHLFSVGNGNLVYELWCDSVTEAIVVRVTEVSSDLYEIKAEKSVKSILKIGYWHHVAVNYETKCDSEKMTVEVRIIINGCIDQKLQLEFKVSVINDNKPFVLLGHRCSVNQVETLRDSWYLGNLFLFKDAVFTPESSLYVYALGPDCCSFADCLAESESLSFAPGIVRKLLHAHADISLLAAAQLISLKPLQESLVLMYSPQNPNIITCYPLIKSNTPIFGNALTGLLPRPADLRFNAEEIRLQNHQAPFTLEINNFGEMTTLIYQGLDSAIANLGGIPIFVFLVGRVMEISNNEEVQAEAVRLLLSLAGRNSRFRMAFLSLGGPALLTKLLSSSQCRISFRLLKEILNACLNVPVMECEKDGQKPKLKGDTEALIIDPELLAEIISAWKVWEKEDIIIEHTFLISLRILIRDDHPHRNFNIQQLSSICLLDLLLATNKERFIHEDSKILPANMCEVMIYLIRCMLGEPPNINLLSSICDFLLLSHSAVNTYVCHSQSSFYYLLASDFSSGVVVVFSKVMGSSNTTSEKMDYSCPSGDFHSNVVSGISKTASSQHNDLIVLVNEKSQYDNSAQFIDSSKLTKALVNLQIKQNSGSSKDAIISSDNVFAVDDSHSEQYKKEEIKIEGANKLISVEEVEHMLNKDLTEKKEASVVQSDDISQLTDYQKEEKDEKIIEDAAAILSQHLEEKRESDNATLEFDGFLINEKKEAELEFKLEQIKLVYSESDNEKIDQEKKMLNPDDTVINSQQPTRIELIPDEGQKSQSSQNQTEGDWEIFSLGKLPRNSELFEADEQDSLADFNLGLLNILCDVVKSLSTEMQHSVLGSLIKPEVLIVFAHNKNSQIRAAIVRLIGYYLSAASDVQINAFLKIKGFHLLANQLFQYPTTVEIAEACLSMITQYDFANEDMYNFAVLKEPTFIQQSSAVVLLAIIPNSFHDIVACHNILHVLQEICEETSEFFQILINQGLIEAVLKLVQNVNHCPSRLTDVISDRNEDLIYSDIKVFLSYLSTSAVSSKGRIPFSSFTDLLLLLSYIERKEVNEGSTINVIKAVRDIQCSCLQAALDSVYHTSYETSKTSKSSKKSENIGMKEGFFINALDAGIPGCLHSADHQQKFEYGTDSADSYNDSVSSAKFLDSVASRKASHQASLSDMHDRLKHILHKAVDFLVHNDYVDASEYEKIFIRFLTQLMVQGAVDILHINGRNKSKQTPWKRMVWANRNSLRLLLCRLLVYLLMPCQLLDQQLFVISVILKEEKRKELIHTVLNSNSQLEKKFSLYLHELTYEKGDALTEQDKEACQLLISLLSLCGIPTLPPPSSPGKTWSLILEEKKNWPEDMKLKKSLWIRQNESLEHKLLSRFDALTKTVSETAMAITRSTVESQNIARKAFIEYIKSLYSHKLQVRQTWQQLILQLTHERAVWHFPESYPQSWQLDPTEGPNRERKRLQRCHLKLKQQYFQPEYRNKLESAFCNSPLAFLYEDESQTLDSAALVDRLHTNEKIRFTCPGTIITPSSETPGEILIGSHCVYFVGEETKLDFCLSQDNGKDIVSLSWSFEEVTEILKRRFELQDNALELFLTNGKTYLIAFSTSDERNDMFRHLIHSNLPNLVETSDLGSLTQLWQDGILTNLEYLTQLNKLAGRSFNDLMQYPVFPFVLSEYSASSLNLLDPHSYRNFSRPMSIQDKNKERHYIKTFSDLKAEQKQGVSSEDLMPIIGPYHYGSHYSNSGIVLHFLVRLPPFTGMFLKYQDSSFDIPDRTFHSIQTSWRLSSSDSNTDMKELVPEFFFLPEFLINTEGFDFGIRQNGERVHDVILPPWSKNNPRLFTLIHRQALESDFVTENIHEWIDLIFGYKQTGKAAVDAINIFHPATYYGFDINSIKNPMIRAAVQTMIKTFGQTPRQLFKKPHPMVALSLIGGQSRSTPVRIKSVLPEIKGLKWGNYVGSPAEDVPVLVWRHTHQPPIGKFISLLTNDVFGLASNCCLIISYCKEKGSSLVNITYVTAAALVSWGHTDSVVRLKLCKDQPPIQFIKSDIFDPICCCSSIPDCSRLFMGHTSGRIDVYNVNFYPAKPKVEIKEKPVQLFGHTGAITQIHICKNYSIVVSASKDKTCIIWDLTRLDFVQSIASHPSAVKLVTVSDTTGDIASVSDADGGSILYLHTINAATIGKVTTNVGISSVCFSNAPEGISVNVVGTGMIDGTIRLWSTWDLSFISIISADKFSEPIICVTYSADSQHLYAANSEGIVVIWERPSKGSAKTPKFHTVV